MPTIKGSFSLRPRPEEWAPCVWCEDPTSFWMVTPFRPEIGSVPLHAMCAAEIIFAYNEFQATKKLGPVDAVRMTRLLEIPPLALDSG
jgi:hypothetical protein